MNDRWDDAVSSLGVPVEIVPGLSAFGYEHTPSNSYRFFGRMGWSLEVSHDADAYLPGDIVTCRIGGDIPHVMIVSDR